MKIPPRTLILGLLFAATVVFTVMFTLVPYLKSRDELPERAPRLIPPKNATNPDKRSLGRLRDLNFVDPELLDYYRKKGMYTKVRSKFPSRDYEEKGLLTKEGIQDSFKELTGIPIPSENVTYLLGSYDVNKYHSYSKDNFNQQVSLYFKVPPSEVEEVIRRTEESLLKKVEGIEIQHRTHTFDKTSTLGKFEFSKGSVSTSIDGVRDKSVNIEHCYAFIGDPHTGLIRITSFRGDQA